VLAAQPPYALAPTSFRFAALAALSGRAPLGGQREVALAIYLSARLAHDVLPEQAVGAHIRSERAGHARSWLSTVVLPAPVRPTVTALVDASAGDRTMVGPAIRAVIAASSVFLDAASLAELDQLARLLDTA
jgi:hypothetical protein